MTSQEPADLVVRLQVRPGATKVFVNISQLARQLENQPGSRKQINPLCESMRMPIDVDDDVLSLPGATDLFLQNLSAFSNKTVIGANPANDNVYQMALLRWDMKMMHVLRPGEAIKQRPEIRQGKFGFDAHREYYPGPVLNHERDYHDFIESLSKVQRETYAASILDIAQGRLNNIPDVCFQNESYVNAYMANDGDEIVCYLRLMTLPKMRSWFVNEYVNDNQASSIILAFLATKSERLIMSFFEQDHRWNFVSDDAFRMVIIDRSKDCETGEFMVFAQRLVGLRAARHAQIAGDLRRAEMQMYNSALWQSEQTWKREETDRMKARHKASLKRAAIFAEKVNLDY